MRQTVIRENCGDDWDYLSRACHRNSRPHRPGQRRGAKNRYQRRARRAAKLKVRHAAQETS